MISALPDPYQGAVTAVIAIALTIVGIGIVILCVLDLPWEDFIMVWRKKQAAKKAKEAAKAMSQLNNLNIEAEQSTRGPTKAQLLASEQEMLRRFRSALEQTKRRNLY